MLFLLILSELLFLYIFLSVAAVSILYWTLGLGLFGLLFSVSLCRSVTKQGGELVVLCLTFLEHLDLLYDI